jgi:hypothetical protein
VVEDVPARTRVLQDVPLGVFGGDDRDPWLAAAGCETRWAGPAVAGSGGESAAGGVGSAPPPTPQRSE